MLLSEVFKSLGDNTRLRILHLLSHRELCVCQMAETLAKTQPNISKHLNRLRYTGLIRCRKVSQWCFYRISDAFKETYATLYEFLQTEWDSTAPYSNDIERLKKLLESNACCQEQMRNYNKE